jgi:hypothetical protein
VQLLKPKRSLEDIQKIQEKAKEKQKEIRSTLEKESKEQKPQGFSLSR